MGDKKKGRPKGLKNTKRIDHMVRIDIPKGYIPLCREEDLKSHEQHTAWEKQEMAWKREIEKKMGLSIPHIICVDIHKGKCKCELYMLKMSAEEKAKFTGICQEVIEDRRNVIEWEK